MLDLLTSISASLFVALLSVLFSHILSERRSFSNHLKGLIAEIRINTKVAEVLRSYMEEELKIIDSERMLLIPFPRFSNASFELFKNLGFLMRVNQDLRSKLIDAYHYMSILNDCLRRREELAFTVSSALNIAKEIKRKNLEFALNIINEKIFPLLNEIANLLSDP